MCLLVANAPAALWGLDEPISAAARPLAALLAATHAVETYVKSLAVGPRVLKAASGNILLGGMAFAALMLE